jgi:hypothetical protein
MLGEILEVTDGRVGTRVDPGGRDGRVKVGPGGSRIGVLT